MVMTPVRGSWSLSSIKLEQAYFKEINRELALCKELRYMVYEGGASAIHNPRLAGSGKVATDTMGSPWN